MLKNRKKGLMQKLLTGDVRMKEKVGITRPNRLGKGRNS